MRTLGLQIEPRRDLQLMAADRFVDVDVDVDVDGDGDGDALTGTALEAYARASPEIEGASVAKAFTSPSPSVQLITSRK